MHWPSSSRAGVFARVWAFTGLLLVAAATPAMGQQPEGVKVLIGFARQPGPAEEALVRAAGGRIKYTYHLVSTIAATVPQAAIDGLRRNPNVTTIELDGEVHAIDAELDNTWGVKRIGSGAVHDGGNKGGGVWVAIIDSGIDYTHPDLGANFAGGHDFVNDDTDPMDDNGHGTHVAGTVAAEDNDVGVVGVAPEAQLYALKVLSASGSGSWSDIIAALQWAVDNGIQVTNNSYGSSLNPGGTVEAAFDNSAAAGVLHVAAAGNSGNPKARGIMWVGPPGTTRLWLWRRRTPAISVPRSRAPAIRWSWRHQAWVLTPPSYGAATWNLMELPWPLLTWPGPRLWLLQPESATQMQMARLTMM